MQCKLNQKLERDKINTSTAQPKAALISKVFSLVNVIENIKTLKQLVLTLFFSHPFWELAQASHFFPMKKRKRNDVEDI